MRIPNEQISRWIVDYFDIWQMNFVNPEGLSSFASDRNIKFWADHISQLWQLGWIRADLIGAQEDLHIEGVQFISEDENGYKYFADNRLIGIPSQNIEDSLRKLENLPAGLDLKFHPFKFYTLYQIQRAISSNINPFQIFIQSRYHKILDNEISGFNQWISSDQFSTLINKWNDISTLAIATEPCYFSYLFGSIRHFLPYDLHVQKTAQYHSELRTLYQQIPSDILNEMLQDLCFNAEILDPNKQIHTLLRFLSGRKRLDIKGDLGGAILLKSMAEIIRRMAEFANGIQLPEEDEMGFGLMMSGIKERDYGVKRIFDSGSHTAKKQILREMKLDPGIRIRWYVEGQTEYYALRRLLSSIPQIEIINLAGQVSQKSGKGVAFRDSLILDEGSQIFSIILLDGDKADNIRVVKKAAEDDIFCGLFYISIPDFEMANFTLDELEEIIWNFTTESGCKSEDRIILHNAIQGQSSGKEVQNETKRSLTCLAQLGKGKEWGEALADYGWKNPILTGTNIERPFILAVKQAVRITDMDFLYHRTKLRVDPVTGNLIQR